MRKVRIFRNNNSITLENQINDWFVAHTAAKVIDRQISVESGFVSYGIEKDAEPMESVLWIAIWYQEVT